MSNRDEAGRHPDCRPTGGRHATFMPFVGYCGLGMAGSSRHIYALQDHTMSFGREPEALGLHLLQLMLHPARATAGPIFWEIGPTAVIATRCPSLGTPCRVRGTRGTDRTGRCRRVAIACLRVAGGCPRGSIVATQGMRCCGGLPTE